MKPVSGKAFRRKEVFSMGWGTRLHWHKIWMLWVKDDLPVVDILVHVLEGISASVADDNCQWEMLRRGIKCDAWLGRSVKPWSCHGDWSESDHACFVRSWSDFFFLDSKGFSLTGTHTLSRCARFILPRNTPGHRRRHLRLTIIMISITGISLSAHLEWSCLYYDVAYDMRPRYRCPKRPWCFNVSTPTRNNPF